MSDETKVTPELPSSAAVGSDDGLGIWGVALACKVTDSGGFFTIRESLTLNLRLVTAKNEEIAKAIGVAEELAYFGSQHRPAELELCLAKRIKDA